MAPPVVPPRHLVLRNLTKAAAGSAPEAPPDRDFIPPPARGDMKLYSFYEPSLVAGPTYSITVSQDANVPDAEGHTAAHQPLPLNPKTPDDPKDYVLSQTQTFQVVAPRFRIEDKDIHSSYPPQGHADQPNILPHVVFNDAHLPWERRPAEQSPDEQDLLPWLAVFPFDCSGPRGELRLTTDQLTGPSPVYTPPAAAGASATPLQQTAAYTLQMTVREYFDLPNVSKQTKVHVPPLATTPDSGYSDADDGPTPVEVIFMSSALFRDLFPVHADTKRPDLTPFRYLAHARNVNTAGMTASGIDDTGLFSVLYSKRTGPVDIAQNSPPRSQIVHMISLEYVDQMDPSLFGDNDLVAFISLYHFTYLCQPPLTVDFVDAMAAIGRQVNDKVVPPPAAGSLQQSCLLRCPDGVLGAIEAQLDKIDFDLAASLEAAKMDKIQSAVLSRLSSGFTMTRYRTSTGEETVAWNRGPLAPVRTPSPPVGDWPLASDNGQDYQIFDRVLGAMDVSYSTAWQVGKLLACSDLGFVAALTRHRTALHQAGTAAASVAVATQSIGLKSKADTMRSLPNSLAAIRQLAAFAPDVSGAGQQNPSLRERWSHAHAVPELVGTAPLRKAAFKAAVTASARLAASAAGSNGAQPFDELSAANSADWAFLHAWILDKMYLSGIPSHYLIGDPSFLPVESIRFFHVDKTWVECMLDGALSVANHLSRDDDTVRAAIKGEMDRYLRTKLKDSAGQDLHYPQVPTYGFFLRSAVVKVFSDLVVEVPYASDEVAASRAPILVQKQMAPDILLVLLDRVPEQLDKIKFSQPPHQQRFSAGNALFPDRIEFSFCKVYPAYSTDDSPPQDNLTNLDEASEVFPRTGDSSDAYHWKTQCLDLDFINTYLFSATTTPPGKFLTNPAMKPAYEKLHYSLNSAMLSLQLFDRIHYLEIVAPAGGPSMSNNDTPYALRLTTATATSTDAAKSDTAARLAAAGGTKTTTTTTTTTGSPLAAASSSRRYDSTASALARPVQTRFTSPLTKATKPAQARTTTPLVRAPSTGTSISISTVGDDDDDPNAPAGTIDACFQAAVYPSTVPYAKGQSFVYVDTPYVPDLVFSVNILPGALAPPPAGADPLYLRYVQFTIPLGDEKDRVQAHAVPTPIAGLGLTPAGASAGARGRMLSNQRWVVHLNPTSSYLFVRIIPRSLQRAVPLTDNRRFSFRLDEVDVAGLGVQSPAPPSPDHRRDVGPVIVAVREEYGYIKSWTPSIVWQRQGTATHRIQVMRKTGWTAP
ncbi:hypothetical protein B0J18DRAFT_432871 [Chaetomium sp. MPI-SDFR-AT-0129]|nr:hypothetical protein B0J18DRAFT_432871 [Chaetomium sp. MPI-SDFR-AT-0129]